MTTQVGLAGKADQVLFMDGGVILEHGAPKAVLVDPQQSRTRTFLHRILDPSENLGARFVEL